MGRILLIATFAAIVIPAPWMLAQSDTSGTRLPPLMQPRQGMGAPPVTAEDEASQQLLKNYRKQRQLELIRDAERLHQLSGELKEFLDKNGSNVLSLDMLKKAETVEKLAHSVRTKMKESQ